MAKVFLANKDFKIGLFSPNCSSGLAVTKAPDRWSGLWEDNLKLAKIADEGGIDFLLPIARWIGYGGDTNFHESVLDPVTWAAGLLTNTSRITVFATIHTAFNHPIVAAKQLATVDQIGNGRAGINIVAGWNKPEYDTFGMDLPQNHDDRYALAQEWWEVIKKIWTTEGKFDHDGKFFQLKHVEGMPKPVDGILPVLNAGSSPQGRGFAARNADYAFTVVGGPEDGAEIVKTVTTQAKTEYNRSMGVFTLGHVVCKPTRKEAEEFLHYYADEFADWNAVDNLMELQGLHSMSFTKEMLEMFRGRFAAGHGSVPLIGSPDDVADAIESYARAGFGGMTIAFLDYAKELPYFVEEVLPRLVKKGVRLPK
jgi:alkanesulfonate monooxygenase SsuD/methylene tetrahydromethanopterin reductase-like flavin-dependent oxidoreductase (luciferase family)